MHKVALPGTESVVSRLALGTASLHHLWSGRDRQVLLATAADLGISHFDTAPYYGFGLAEKELGRFMASGHRNITVTTKIGLYPPRWESGYTASIWARKLAGRLLPVLARPVVDWSVARARRSLEQSLRRLRRDRIDFLLLHEPRVNLLDSEEFVNWLYREHAAGKIGAWGLAGDIADMEAWLKAKHPLGQVLQVRDSLGMQEANLLGAYGRAFQFSFGYLSPSAGVAAKDILRSALLRNTTGSVLVSSRNVVRLAELAAVAEEL